MACRQMIRLFFLVLVAGMASGCSLVFKDSGGKKIANYDDRSIVFGWLDMSESGDRLDRVVFEQLKPVTKKKYYTMGIIRQEKGYIVYHIGMPEGTFKLSNFTGHSCLINPFFMCDAGTIYDMPRQGSTGGIVVGKSGAYYLGALKYKRVKTGFFEAGKFEIEEDKDPPSQEAMLKAIHEKLQYRFPDQMQRLESILGEQG